MADDISKSITISLRVINDATKTLKDASANILGVVNSVKQLSTQLSGMKSNVDAFVAPIAKLSKVKVPNVENFAKGFERLATKVKQVPNFDPFVTQLKKVTELKAPNILSLANGLTKLKDVRINDFSNKLTALQASLQQFKKIELPNLLNIGTGLEKLAALKNIGAQNTKLTALAAALRTLDKIELPNLAGIGQGLEKISKLKSIGPVNQRLKSLATSLASLKGVELPKFGAFSSFLKNISKIKIPSMQKIVNDVNLLSEAFARLNKSERVVSALSRIGVAADIARRNLNTLKKSTDDNVSSFEIFGSKITRYLQYRVIADSVFALKNAFHDSLNTIIEYDQALKNLQAITRATDTDISLMGDKIEDVASRTKFSVTEIAEGMVILGQAGYAPSQVIDTIGAAADLATGTLTNLSTSVDLLTTAMNIFQIDASQSARVADVFANAVNGSKLTIDKLRVAFNYVGPIAKDAGVNFDELNAALMRLANSGLRASTMGTSLRKILNEIVEPSKKFVNAVHKAGLTLGDLDIQSEGFTAVLKNLKTVLTDVQGGFINVGLAAELVGARAVSGLVALVSNVNDSRDSFTAMLEKTAEVGSAATMARIQLTGLGTSIKNLKDRIGVLYVALGKSGLIDVMRVWIDIAKSAVVWTTKLTNDGLIPLILQVGILTVAFQGLFYVMKGLVVLKIGGMFAQFSADLFFATAGLTGMTKAVFGLRTAFVLLSRAILTSPFFWAITAATALTYIIGKLTDKTKSATEAFGEHGQKLAEIYNKYRENTQILKTYGDQVKDLIENANPNNILETQSRHRDLIHQLVKIYPEYAQEIVGASHSLTKLQEVLEELNKVEKYKYLEESRTEATGLAEDIKKSYELIETLQAKQQAQLKARKGQNLTYGEQQLAKAVGVDDDSIRELSDQLNNAERDVDAWVARIALIIMDFQNMNIAVPWDQVLGVDVAERAFTYIKELAARASGEEQKLTRKKTPKDLINIFENEHEAATKAYKRQTAEITALQSQDFENKEKYEIKKLNLTLDFYAKQERAARILYAKIRAIDRRNRGQFYQEKEKANDILQKLETESANSSLGIIEDLGDQSARIRDKMISNSQQQADETVRNSTRVKDIRDRHNLSIEQNEDQHADRILRINEQLNKKLLELQQQHESKIKKYTEDRTKSYQAYRNSLEDFSRSIGNSIESVTQRLLTGTEIQMRNATSAAEKLETAITQISKAQETGNKKSLRSTERLLRESAAMFEGLNDPKIAIEGLQRVEKAYASLTKVQIKIENDEYARKVKLADALYAQEENKARLAHNTKLLHYDQELAEALNKSNVLFKSEMDKESIRHKTKLANLERENFEYEKTLTETEKQQKRIIEAEGYNVLMKKQELEKAKKSLADSLENEASLKYSSDIKANAEADAEFIQAVIDKEQKLRESLAKQITLLLTVEGEEDFNSIRADVEEFLRLIENKGTGAQAKTFWDYFLSGAKQAADTFTDVNERALDLGKTLTDNISSAIDEAVDNTKSLRESFADAMRSMAKDIQKFIIKLLLVQSIYAALGWLKGGGTKSDELIKSVPAPSGGYTRAATGGPIPGSSPTTTADNIPIWATAGEFMQPVKAVRHYGMAFMEAIRTLRLPKVNFAMGGMIPQLSIPKISIPSMKGYATGGAIGGSSGGMFSLNFYMGNDSGSKTSQTSPANMKDVSSGMELFAKQIGTLVETKLIQEQRPGGLLSRR